MDSDQTDAVESTSSRRDIIKKGAIAGGAAVWAAPVLQTVIAGPAGAATATCEPSAAPTLTWSVISGENESRVYGYTVTPNPSCGVDPLCTTAVTNINRDLVPGTGAVYVSNTRFASINCGADANVTVRLEIDVLCGPYNTETTLCFTSTWRLPASSGCGPAADIDEVSPLTPAACPP